MPRLAGDQFRLEGDFGWLIRALNENFNTRGFVMIGSFIVAWAASVVVYRLKSLDEIPAGIASPRRLTSDIIAGLATGTDPVSKRRARV